MYSTSDNRRNLNVGAQASASAGCLWWRCGSRTRGPTPSSSIAAARTCSRPRRSHTSASLSRRIASFFVINGCVLFSIPLPSAVLYVRFARALRFMPSGLFWRRMYQRTRRIDWLAVIRVVLKDYELRLDRFARSSNFQYTSILSCSIIIILSK